MNHLVKYGRVWQIRWLAKMMASAPATDNNELLVLRVRILSEIERGGTCKYANKGFSFRIFLFVKIFIYFPFRSSDVSTEIVSIEQMFELKAINYCSMQTYRYIYLDDDDKYQSLKCARQSRSRELLAISFFYAKGWNLYRIRGSPRYQKVSEEIIHYINGKPVSRIFFLRFTKRGFFNKERLANLKSAFCRNKCLEEMTTLFLVFFISN